MNRVRQPLLLALVCSMLCLVTLAFAGQAKEIRLKDGSKWRGEVNQVVEVRFMQSGNEVPITGKLIKVDDLFIKVEGTIGGMNKEQVIFKTDIVTMKSIGGPPADVPADAAPATGVDKSNPADKPSKHKPTADGKKPLGVFVLPLSGMVGEGFRSEEMEAVAKEADKFGPGQIIILRINSGGGLAIEMERIHYTLVEIKKRHRVVAWIEEAISAAAATASNCDEIYFTTEGVMGAMTMFAGGVSAKGEELRKWMELAGRMFEAGGRSPYIAWAMIDDEALLSYDIDETGNVLWRNDLGGQHKLSDEKTNLTFTSSTAMACKFADGIADTNEDMAKLLDLPEWRELSDKGRKLADEWTKTVDKCKEELPLLAARLDYKGASKGTKAQIGAQIQIMNDIISWWDRCYNVCFLQGLPPKADLERQVAELRKILADINKAERRAKT